MQCRVFANPDGSVRVFHPSRKKLAMGLSFESLAERTIQAVPDLQGLPFMDKDTADLPPRNEPCPTCGKTYSVRNQWRLSGGKVVVDDKPATVAKNLPRTIHRTADDLDAALAAAVPDPVKVTRLNRELEKLRRGR